MCEERVIAIDLISAASSELRSSISFLRRRVEGSSGIRGSCVIWKSSTGSGLHEIDMLELTDGVIMFLTPESVSFANSSVENGET